MPFYINLFECWIKDCNITLIGFEWYWEENEQQYKSLSSLLKPKTNFAINNTWNCTHDYVWIVFALILLL